jgi:putative ABC transport system permease protein
VVRRLTQPSRTIVYLLPRAVRERDGAELEEAFAACVRRERGRFGMAGAGYAWARILVDTAAAGVTTRLDQRRARRIAALRAERVSNGESAMSSLWQDVRYALRGMRRAPIFSAVVTLTLALAIGANAAIFGVVNAVLLRSMPYPDPHRLVMVYEAIPKALSGPIGFSAPDYVAFEQRVRSFEGVAAFRNRDFELSGVDQPERVTALRVSASFFHVLGVNPAFGRPFTRDEDDGRKPVAILHDGLWRRQFGADPSVIGRAVILDRQSYEIVGVMPRGFTFPSRGPLLNNEPAELYVPISFTDRERASFGSMYNNSVVARLKPGVTAPQAEAETRAVVGQLVQDIYPATLSQMGLSLSASALPLRDETVGRVQTLLYVLLAAVGVVLLIACADIANLLLTRAAAREREMAVRAALGAGRARLMRQMLVESAVLAICGGAVGLLFARWASMALVSAAPATLPRLNEMTMDVRVLAFTVALSLATALLCGLLPAWELSRRDSGDALKEGGRTASSGRRQRRIFGALVTAQFALAVVLLVAGGLLIRSFSRLMAVDPGFQAEHVLTLRTSLPAAAYPNGADVRSFYVRLLDAVERLPGVSAVGGSTWLPLAIRERRAFTIEAQPDFSRELPHTVAHDWVLGQYFEAFDIPLRRGRYLSPADHATSEPVVVINETMARQFWADQDPIGQRVAWGGRNNHGRWIRIVGVVADVKQGPLAVATVPQTFQPWLQVDDSMLAENVLGIFRGMRIAMRTATEPTALASAVRGQIRALDPSLPITAVQSMEDVVRLSTGPQRFNAIVLGSFACLALLLAALGIGGVLATSVSRRTQEMGVRLALGAQPGDLLRMVVRQGMALALVGLAIGLPAALALTRGSDCGAEIRVVAGCQPLAISRRWFSLLDSLNRWI